MEKLLGAQPDMVLGGMTARQVQAWFVEAAPEHHRHYVGPKTPGGGPLQFAPWELSASPAGQLPGVSNVRLVHLTGTDRPQVLLTEMRDGRILLFDPDEPRDGFRLIGRARHPARSVVVDLDQDGLKDVLVSDLGIFFPSNATMGAVRWLRQRPDGGFDGSTLLAGVGRVADAQGADLDGDGDLDVAVAVYGWRTVGRVMALERHAGKIIRHTVLARTGALQVEVRDMDGDGKNDLVVLWAQEHERVTVLLNRGDWLFEERVLAAAPHPAWGFAGMQMVDVDGDGDEDILLTNGDTLDVASGAPPGAADRQHMLMPYHGVTWLEQVGTLEFKHRTIGPMYGVHRAQAADMDGDGDIDVVASSFMPAAPEDRIRQPYRPEALLWFERLPSGGWARHNIATMEVEIPTFDIADIDGDGDLDIATGHLFVFLTRPNHRDVSLTLWMNNRLHPARP